jgi:hypothetical protein
MSPLPAQKDRVLKTYLWGKRRHDAKNAERPAEGPFWLKPLWMAIER